MNFSSLIHGAVGAIVSDSLQLHELATLTRVSHSTHQLVKYKYPHMKYFDMTALPRMTLMNFAHMCARLRGIEVLHLPDLHSRVNHPDELQPFQFPFEPESETESSIPTDTDESTVAEETSSETPPISESNATTKTAPSSHPIHRRLRQLFTLLDNNRTTLRVLTEPKMALGKRTSTDNLVRFHIQGNLHLFTSLEVFACDLVPCHSEMLLAQYDKYGAEEPDLFWEKEAQRPKNHQLYQLVLDSTPALTQAESEHYERIHGNEKSVVQTDKELSIRIIDQMMYMNIREVNEYVRLLPHLEAIFMGFADSDNWASRTNGSSSSGGLASLSLSAEQTAFISFFQIESGLSHTVPLWSNLLHLAIFSFGDYNAKQNLTRVEFRLPNLLQLSLDSYSVTSSITDIEFYCPELIALRVSIACQVTPDIESKLRPGIAAQIDDSRCSYITAPSLLKSIKSSPKICNLNCSIHPVAHNITMDYSDSLTQEEKVEITAKSKRLGFVSPLDDANEEPEIRRCTRIFYYALSLLPCVDTLEMIEFAPRHINLHEYCALFPHLQSISNVPLWFYCPRWFRPHESEDESHYLYLHKRTMKEYSQRANRMHTRKETSELTIRDHPCVAIFNLCSDEMVLTIAMTVSMLTRPLLTQLRSVFFAAPTIIESSQVISQLFLSCRQLEHASLMQLDGIDNTVFTSLPVDCVRSSLVTLRIKTPCGVDPSKTLNEELLTRDLLPRLFPCLRHLEYIIAFISLSDTDDSLLTFVPNTLNRFCDILEPSNSSQVDIIAISKCMAFSSKSSLLWPHLTTLIVRLLPDGALAQQSESIVQRLIDLFSQRFDVDYMQTHPHPPPELILIQLRTHEITNSNLSWYLSPRSEIERKPKKVDTSLTVIVSEETYTTNYQLRGHDG